MNTAQATSSDMERGQAAQSDLAALITRALPEDGSREMLPGLWLHRYSSLTEPLHGVSAHAFCVIAQGSKQVLVGSTPCRYDPAHYLIATAELPVVSQITEASPERPYLSLRLDLDPALVSSVMVEAGYGDAGAPSSVQALQVHPLDTGLLDAAVRLVRLVGAPGDAAYLAPLIVREIVYRLLTGKDGSRLRQLAMLNGASHRIAAAIDHLRQEYDQPLRIADIARDAGMSVSGFHHHFKAVTAMSPLQFQKQLRLQEARRLMLGEGYDATTAGFHVGYEDTSHFNREYKRLFGEPPRRDIDRLRGAVLEPTGA